MFRKPDAEVPEVEAFLATSHEKWMRTTHQGPAEPSPLVYTITQAAELKNSLDPSGGNDGSHDDGIDRGLPWPRRKPSAHGEFRGLAGHWSHAGKGDRQLFRGNDHAR